MNIEREFNSMNLNDETPCTMWWMMSDDNMLNWWYEVRTVGMQAPPRVKAILRRRGVPEEQWELTRTHRGIFPAREEHDVMYSSDEEDNTIALCNDETTIHSSSSDDRNERPFVRTGPLLGIFPSRAEFEVIMTSDDDDDDDDDDNVNVW